MKKCCFLSTLVLLTVLLGKVCDAQDFSNKGKDFWVAYGYHQIMNNGNGQDMRLYFAAEQNANVTIEIPGIGYVQNLVVPGNTVVASNPIPKNIPFDARLTAASTTAENKGIHITSDRPIVAYAHIYNSSVSGATILYPTATLGKEYYSINYTNISNTPNANCWFYVIAADTGTTTVEITPSAAAIGHAAGVPFTVNLTQGQVYNVMGTTSGNSGVDLTGSLIKSVSSAAGGCKRIAVFSGSGRIAISCNGTAPSSDNYMVQSVPKSAWGKKFLTTPTLDYSILSGNTTSGATRNFYRICVSDPTTVVRVNGAVTALPFINNFYYEIPSTAATQLIEADKPITVAQYLPSQGATGCGTVGGDGDPETIYLSPIEQSISKVLWNANAQAMINVSKHYINVIIPNGGTALSSFRLDGNPVPATAFVVHPRDANYSYAVLNVSSVPGGIGGGVGIPHIIQSDSGFNAIAYGYGQAESYGYNAGTNIKDIYQFVSIRNNYATVNFPATCKNTPFTFSMTFPYQPTRIQWIFNGLFPDVDIPAPVPTSTSIVNGRTLYTYDLAGTFTIPAAGTYPIKVIATNPTPDGCGGIQEIDYDLQVFDPPTNDFTFSTTGCVTSPVQFTSTNNPGGGTINNWYWSFGDGNLNTTSANPTHTYTAAGSYTVKYAIRTDVGCISDTASHVVTMSDLPIAKFGHTLPACAGSPITFSDTSSVTGSGTIIKWNWNFGDATPPLTAFTNADQVHTYAAPGTYTATLTVETNAGCISTVFSKQITIHPNPVANFNLPSICLPSGNSQFNDLSTIPTGTITGWSWDFGDGGSSTLQNPTHSYASAGPFNVTLTVTSSQGCINTRTQALTTVFAEPQAAFSSPTQVCLGSSISFTDNSTAPGSSVTQWNWNFGDGNNSTAQNPSHTYATAGTYTVTLNVTSAAGCGTVNNAATRTVVVNPLPTINFSTSNPVCEFSNIQFTSTSVPNAGTFSQYNWTVNGSPAGNSSTINYTPTSSGPLTVQLSATTDLGCSGTNTLPVNVNPKPVASFALPVVCLPAGVANFSSSSTISAGSITSYSWNFGDGNTSTQQNPTHTYTGAGPFNVTLTVTSNNGCTDDSVRVMSTLYPEPQAAFNAAAEVCLGGSVSFTDASTATGSSVTQWSWNFGDGNTSTLQNPTHTYTTAGTYTVTLNVTSAIGCQTVNNAATRTVVVNPLPTADFNPSIPGCVGKSITFTDASAANAGALIKWTWNFGDGNSTVATNNSPVSHTYNTVGTYNVTLQVETDKGCVSIIRTKPVEINVRPKAGFIQPIACSADILAAFTDTSTVSTGTIAGWNWTFGDPNASGSNPNTSTVQNPTHHYTVAGPYTAQLVAITDKGCTDTARTTFTINGSVPVANFSVQNSTSLCSNRQVSITDASSVNIGSLIRTEIFWDYTNDPTIKIVDNTPTVGENYTHTYPEFGSPASRTVTIRYVVYSGQTCLHTLDRTITLLATPSLQFGNVPSICEGIAPFQVTQAQIVNGLPGTGTFSGTGISSTGLFDPAAAGAGQHVITYSFTGTNGCTNSITNTIEVNPKPAINAGADKVVLQGGSVVLTPSSNIGVPVTYLWTPPTGLNNPTLANPTASPADDITYTLIVTSDKNCSDTDQVFVKVLKSPVIPNIFSPNGDNIHDRWEIPYLESYPGCTIDIYNRYGNLVYHSVGYTRPWDGKVNGKDVPVGTYYYVIDPKNGRTKMAGYVDVIR